MTAYDGTAITYDAIGNPLSYYNGTSWSFTWENGRSLASASGNGSNITYTYDATGQRTSKTVNGVTYHYYYVDGKLRRMTDGTNTTTFFYDESGKPFGMNRNGTYYYYVTNLQGDVLRVTTADGTVVASYEYDPYGKIISGASSAEYFNPLCYRGYLYDAETGFYYLGSRYYDPITGRFINADSYVSTGQGIIGNNMFAYCLNNPVNCVDRSGNNTEAAHWWTSTMWWLCGADTALPAGDIIYVLGILILGFYDLIVADEVTLPQIYLEEEEKKAEPEIPDVTYPGDDPAKAPDGYEWKGPDEQGGKRGGYANPNGKDSWHPDLEHPDGIDPHWDYNDGLGNKWRVFPNRIERALN